MKLRFLFLFLVVTLAGCGTTSTLPSGARYDKNQTYVLLGIQPSYRVHLLIGEDVGESGWMKPGLDTPIANVFPMDGYIVLALNPTKENESYGISMLLTEGVGGPVFVPCKDGVTPTFKLKKGVLNYVGDVKYENRGDGFSSVIAIEESRAKDYLKKHYPEFMPGFLVQPINTRRVLNGNCGPRSVTIPVPVGR